ncbi:MAG TPA: tetratricopeptide repeat protein [Burkholderiaceae bacterium]|nr:tetratricopeptide repeat protein [Burkholderiaceae bacterium]
MTANLNAARELRASGRHEEARTLLAALAAAAPHDAELQYETACVHDFLGLEPQAIPYYLAALAGELADGLRRSAYTGLGSTYRTLGRYAEAEQILQEALRRYPRAAEVRVFLAMVQHNLGQSKAAVESLLALLAQTSSDPEIKAYATAIEFYAQDIERVWPAAAG